MWNLKHIAQCYKALKQTEDAAKYMLKALELRQESVQLNLLAGHYLLDDKKIDEAITLYYKADYLDDKDHAAWRPLAWCLFLKKDFEQSRIYFNKIIDNLKHEVSDYMNFGHLCLAEHRFEEAMAYYYNAFTLCDSDVNKFTRMWNGDAEALSAAGIDQQSISLLSDAIAMRLTSNI